MPLASKAKGHMMDLSLVLFGLVVGLLIGLTGIGGGALMAPALIFWFGVPPVVAIGTDLAYSAVTKVFGATQHFIKGNVRLGLGVRLAAGSVPGAILAGGLTEWLKAVDHVQLDLVIKRSLGVTLLIVGALMVVQVAGGASGAGTGPVVRLRGTTRLGLDVAVAAVIGFLVGLTSVGSGSLVVAWLSLTRVLPGRVVVGTDLFNACLLTAAASVVHFKFGNVDPSLMVNLLAGSVPGVVVGTHLTLRLPNRALRGCLAVILLGVGLFLARL